MEIAYWMIPDEEQFKANIPSAKMGAAAQMQLHELHIDKLCFDISGTSWQVYYHSNLPIQPQVLAAAAQQLKAAFSLAD